MCIYVVTGSLSQCAPLVQKPFFHLYNVSGENEADGLVLEILGLKEFGSDLGMMVETGLFQHGGLSVLKYVLRTFSFGLDSLHSIYINNIYVYFIGRTF